MRLKSDKKEGIMIFLEEGDESPSSLLLYFIRKIFFKDEGLNIPSLSFCFIRKFFKKTALCASEKLEDCLPERDFLELIKGIQGIYYDEANIVLTVTETLPEIKFRKILYWLRIRRYIEPKSKYDYIANILIKLFEKTHQRYFFQKSHITYRSSQIYKVYFLKDGDVFSGGYISPHFWLEWKATFYLVDKGKAYKKYFWYYPSDLCNIVKNEIRSSMAKYMFEVGDTNSCSCVYEKGAMLDKNLKEMPEPKYLGGLWFILQEAKEKINSQFLNDYDLKLQFLSEETYWPIQRPYLGLWEWAQNKSKEAWDKIDKPMLLKIKTLQVGPTESDKEIIQIDKLLKKEEVSELESQKIDFYFTKQSDIREVRIEGVSDSTKKEIIEAFKRRKQIYSLLKFWLELRSPIHWLHGFIMFDSWRKEDLNDMMNAFSQCMTSLGNLGTNTGLWTIEFASREKGNILKKGHWRLEDIQFSSNIFKAQKLLDEAKKCKEDLEKKINLIKACEAYPEYLDAHLLLAECWEKDGFNNLKPEEIEKPRRFFVDKEAIYNNALTKIIQLQLQDKKKESHLQLPDKKKESYWTDRNVTEVIDEMHATFLKINRFSTILEKWCKKQKILSPGEEICDRMKVLLESKNYELLLKESVVKKAIGNSLHHLGLGEEVDYDKGVDLTIWLTNIYKEGEIDTEKADMLNNMYEAFLDLVRNGKVDTNSLKAGDLEGFKKYLTAALFKETGRIIGKDHPLKEIATDDPHNFAKKSQNKFSKDTEDISEEDTSEDSSL